MKHNNYIAVYQKRVIKLITSTDLESAKLIAEKECPVEYKLIKIYPSINKDKSYNYESD